MTPESGDSGDDSRWGIEIKCINNPDWYEYDVSHDNLMVQISPSGNHFIKCSIVPVIAASAERGATLLFKVATLTLHWVSVLLVSVQVTPVSAVSLLLQISAAFQSHQSCEMKQRRPTNAPIIKY